MKFHAKKFHNIAFHVKIWPPRPFLKVDKLVETFQIAYDMTYFGMINFLVYDGGGQTGLYAQIWPLG